MARRKLTKKSPIKDTEDLPLLTEGQMAFVMAKLEGLTSSDAYVKAHPGWNGSREALWVIASRTNSNPKVKLWLQRAMAEACERGGYTLTNHVEALDTLCQKAIDSGNIGAAVQAEQLKGRALGFYIERFRNENEPTADDVMEKALRIFGEGFKDTDTYKRLQKRLN